MGSEPPSVACGVYVDEHNRVRASAFRGKTPNEMYVGRGHDTRGLMCCATAARRARVEPTDRRVANCPPIERRLTLFRHVEHRMRLAAKPRTGDRRSSSKGEGQGGVRDRVAAVGEPSNGIDETLRESADVVTDSSASILRRRPFSAAEFRQCRRADRTSTATRKAKTSGAKPTADSTTPCVFSTPEACRPRPKPPVATRAPRRLTARRQ